jgi:hypothetical protein
MLLMSAKSATAPGEGEISTLLWKALWRYLADVFTRMFTQSVDLGYYPEIWKRAKTIVLRKPNKTDCSVPGASRPISILNTLGKLLEAVIAKRQSFWAESHRLLPNT